MQNADTILKVLRDRGSKGLPLDRVYRLLFNPELYHRAYGKLAQNRGARTPGATDETIDAMSVRKINAIITLLRQERYRWTPVRRIYIEKPNSTKKRPLGLPTWSDKVVQEVIRTILEAYFEPQFSDWSHGFRPGRGCHTALSDITHRWVGTTWFIEGDISACFDSLDHEVLLAILAEKLHDNRFLRLIENLLKAGYLEDWTFNRTRSGTPQGGVLSPVLSNIYLDRLDRFVAETLLPAYNRGAKKQASPIYNQFVHQAHWLRANGYREEARALRRQMRAIPSQVTDDPAFRRLRYVRYADDFLLGFIGSKAEAEEIKHRIGEFLRDQLKLTLSEAKTLITHARTERARFLGYEISIFQADRKLDRRGYRTVNGSVALRVPADVVRAKCAPYLRDNKPIDRPERVHDTDFSIIEQYQAEYRGVVEYYQLAHNLRTLSKLRWVMETSLAKTLARKLKTSVTKVYKRYRATITTADGTYTGLQVVKQRTGRKPLVAT